MLSHPPQNELGYAEKKWFAILYGFCLDRLSVFIFLFTT